MEKCLIVVDYQNDFISGSLKSKNALSICDEVCNQIDVYRNSNAKIIFTLDTHYDDYSETREGKIISTKHCILNTVGHDIYEKVKKHIKEEDLFFLKDTYGSKDLFHYLSENEYKEIVFCGVVTNICVLVNVILAITAKPNASVSVIRKAIASNKVELQEKTLDILSELGVIIL